MNERIKELEAQCWGHESTYEFYWDSQMSSLTLHNKTRDEAIRIAREFGWTEPRWYKPKTWGNFMTFYGVKHDDIGF